MVGYTIYFSKTAQKQKKVLKAAALENKTRALLEVLGKNPFQNPPPFEKLTGDLKGLYSRRINVQHRLVYTVDESTKIISVLSMWSHYEF